MLLPNHYHKITTPAGEIRIDLVDLEIRVYIGDRLFDHYRVENYDEARFKYLATVAYFSE
ncbi:hypothetical protein AYR62_06925 [Secundilactobacillus paracollinoides]|uniref:hypothetical protein n=1 Tax=Secundilactobacillus paracollinoides TaxID=240427 RepID=UPI0006D02F5E|nr:hypothetical protein [Secundilactobacillus paracollinoides]ANZ62161.1 hypothetical protein AYR61_12940 [Secundilactobacillus paracollinoides]ANZ63850.1 hypothetical protein AYR62_06925 [Secundilactobacillus paracollinoides]KRL76413.1 hypothetical protein FC17_GL001916 [Secundilactobacillus paracollinoides DSM 15502 = JCM 11969]